MRYVCHCSFGHVNMYGYQRDLGGLCNVYFLDSVMGVMATHDFRRNKFQMMSSKIGLSRLYSIQQIRIYMIHIIIIASKYQT